MKHRIDVQGVIVPNDYADFYEWAGEDYTCPNMVSSVIDKSSPGDEIAVYINSPGGVIDCGSEIYTMLREASADRDVTIYITGQACSAASVIACAAYSEMSPTALMMVHCVSSGVIGNHNDMEQMAETLKIADHALCQAYVEKTGMSEEEALAMMEAETWLSAKQAKEIGLVDAIMFDESENDLMVAAIGLKLPTQEELEQARKALKADDLTAKRKRIIEAIKVAPARA